MGEIVEKHCHVQVPGHAGNWTVHGDGSWVAEYGPHSEAGQSAGVDEAREHSRGWVDTMHKAYTGSRLPSGAATEQ